MFKEYFRNNKSSLAIVAITSFVASIIYESLNLKNGVVSILVFIVLPIILIPVIYSYAFKKKKKENE